MDSQSKVYSRRQLITVAEVANALAYAKDIAGLEAVPELAEAASSGKLCPDIYPPHQQWQNGGDSSRIGQPASNSKQVWRSLAAKCTERHISDKDDFNYPPAASTYHLLADDVFAFACSGGLGVHASTALRELAVRYKKELASEPQAVADAAPTQSPASSAPVAGKRWTPEKLAELKAYRDTHTMPETAAQFGISEARIRALQPSKKPKAKPFAGLIHRMK